MCGIVGFQGSFPRELLLRMTQAVEHRGPDAEGAVVISQGGSTTTGLGHRRLSIIDLSSSGRQPMCAPVDAGGGMQSGLTLVYNGEIYNFRELRGELAADGHSFHSDSDSEVLLHLYERDGLEMLGRLNGIFAFAIHDARESGRPDGVARGALFVARDHLGVKPFYYAEQPAGFLFASEIKALLEYEGIPRDIDPIALHSTLAYLWSPAPRTLLSAVKKLPGGMAMIVADGRVTRSWRHYDIPYRGERLGGSFDEIARELAGRVETAVTRQLVADVPVGAYLSGGLDSSAVVAMMRRARPGERISCFSIGFRGLSEVEGNPNDLPFARRVAEHLDVDLHEIEIEPSAIDRLPEMVSLLDEPQADPAPINALMIAEEARRLGIPVLLSGAGGDDLFSGYRRHWALQAEGAWAWLPFAVRRRLQEAARAVAAGAVPGQSRPALRRLAKMFLFAAEDPDRRLVSYFLWSTEESRRALYTRGFAEQLDGVDATDALMSSLRDIPAEDDPLQRMLYLEARHFLADHNLNYTDRAGMAVGVEVRVPLLDRELVEFATRVPASMKQRGRTGKAVFKRAMEPYLPKEVIYRPKSGFAVPLRRWIGRELRPIVEDTLSPSRLASRGIFDPAAVSRLVEMDRIGRIDASYTIFALVCLELWFRRFVDRELP